MVFSSSKRVRPALLFLRRYTRKTRPAIKAMPPMRPIARPAAAPPERPEPDVLSPDIAAAVDEDVEFGDAAPAKGSEVLDFPLDDLVEALVVEATLVFPPLREGLAFDDGLGVVFVLGVVSVGGVVFDL
jgi:hypothetical protein